MPPAAIALPIVVLGVVSLEWRHGPRGSTGGNHLRGPKEEVRGAPAPGAKVSDQAVISTMANRRRQALAGLQKGLVERYLEAPELPKEAMGPNRIRFRRCCRAASRCSRSARRWGRSTARGACR